MDNNKKDMEIILKGKIKYAYGIIRRQERTIDKRFNWCLKNLDEESLWGYIENDESIRIRMETLTVIDEYENKKGRKHMAHFYLSGFGNCAYYMGPVSKLGDKPIKTFRGTGYPTRETHYMTRDDDGNRIFRLQDEY